MDLGKIRETYRGTATNMCACSFLLFCIFLTFGTRYKAKDGVFFHLHGSLDTTSILHMLDLPQHRPDLQDRKHYETVRQIYRETVSKYDSEWLDIQSNEHWRQAGTICYKPEEFLMTRHGQAMANEPIYNIHHIHEDLPAVPWPCIDDPRKRPLAGIKVLDLSRVVAGPTVGSVLALLGATVLRISSDTLPDTILLFDTQIGKKDTRLNLKTAEGKKKLANLVEDADVLLDAYRPGALAKLGFSEPFLQSVAKRRGKGIVYARECCYGWKGEWAHRSGWQQISDAVGTATRLHKRLLFLCFQTRTISKLLIRPKTKSTLLTASL
ncbi:CoA-transferase family III [Pyrenochaeta sp. DS3sAY3a]|nr:CoA-transferase family III [Pyrenochaeta sp. DS3sAY3a]